MYTSLIIYNLCLNSLLYYPIFSRFYNPQTSSSRIRQNKSYSDENDDFSEKTSQISDVWEGRISLELLYFPSPTSWVPQNIFGIAFQGTSTLFQKYFCNSLTALQSDEGHHHHHHLQQHCSFCRCSRTVLPVPVTQSYCHIISCQLLFSRSALLPWPQQDISVFSSKIEPQFEEKPWEIKPRKMIKPTKADVNISFNCFEPFSPKIYQHLLRIK